MKTKTEKHFRHRFAALTSAALIGAQLFAGTIYIDQSKFILINPEDVVEATNSERTTNGLNKLAESATLNLAAAAKLKDMQNSGYWDHNSPSGKKPWDFIKESGYAYSFAGENLAKGYTDSKSVVNAWMHSEEHKANILSKDYTEIGVAVGKVNLGGKDSVVTVQMFGAPTVLGASFEKAAVKSSESTSFNLFNPVSKERIPFFGIWLVLFAIIVYDGAELRRRELHKSKNHVFDFRTAVVLNSIAFLLLFINITAIT